jgi:hypothetical protein
MKGQSWRQGWMSRRTSNVIVAFIHGDAKPDAETDFGHDKDHLGKV